MQQRDAVPEAAGLDQLQFRLLVPVGEQSSSPTLDDGVHEQPVLVDQAGLDQGMGQHDAPVTTMSRPSCPAELGYRTTGLTIGQRVFGVADWTRNGTLAEYVAVEARNLAPLSGGVDHTVAAALPISGLTAWQALFDHGRLAAGQTVLIHGAAGAVGSMAVQLALEAGARVVGTGRARHGDTVLGLGAHAFVDLDRHRLEDLDEVDVALDVIGGETLDRSAKLVRPGGVLVTIAEPPRVMPEQGRAIFFVVEADRECLVRLERRVRDGRLRPPATSVRPLSEAVAAFDSRHGAGKPVIRIAADDLGRNGSRAE